MGKAKRALQCHLHRIYAPLASWPALYWQCYLGYTNVNNLEKAVFSPFCVHVCFHTVKSRIWIWVMFYNILVWTQWLAAWTVCVSVSTHTVHTEIYIVHIRLIIALFIAQNCLSYVCSKGRCLRGENALDHRITVQWTLNCDKLYANPYLSGWHDRKKNKKSMFTTTTYCQRQYATYHID